MKDMFQQMKRAKSRVEFLLRNYPPLRDSDSRLIAVYWYNEIAGDVGKMTGIQVLQKISEGKLSKAESIRRVRQKLQEQNPELRGEMWFKSQGLASEIKKEIHNL